jgi:hypothetical protein
MAARIVTILKHGLALAMYGDNLWTKMDGNE